MIPMQTPLPPHDGAARGPVLSRMRAVQDGPVPEGSGPRGGFAGVMSRQPSKSGDREGLDQPVAPEETHETRLADTPSPGAAVAEDTSSEGDASVMGLSDGAVRSPSAETRAPENRTDGKAQDPSEAVVKAPQAGERPPRAPTGDVSGGVPRARANPPGPGLAAVPGTVDWAPMAGRVPLQEGSASGPSGRQPGAAHPPRSGADPMHPRAEQSINQPTQAGHVSGAPAGRDPSGRTGMPIGAGQAPPPRPDPRSAAQRDRPAGTETAQAAGPALSASQRVAVAAPASPLPAPFRAMLMSTDQMARQPVEDAARPLGDLAAGSTADRPAGATSSVGPATPSAARAVPAQIAQQIAVSVSFSESGHAELRLNPEELGRVRLSLSGAEGGLTVSITAERPETADLLRRHTDSLAREFAALGYGDVGFHFEGESREDRAHDHPGGQAAGAPERTLTDATDPQPPRRGIVLGGGLDLKL